SPEPAWEPICGGEGFSGKRAPPSTQCHEMQGVGGTPDTAAAFHESDLGHDIVRQVESQGQNRAGVAAAAAAGGTDYIGSDRQPPSTAVVMYIHQTLDEQCIRILTLSAGPFESDLHISLDHAKLDAGDPPSYEALSYTWGGNHLSHMVFVDTKDGQQQQQQQQSLPVTENLHAALLHLRDTSSLRTLWIDAICINQDDKEERSRQVARMGDIYKSAAKVIIWLGPEGGNSTAATHALEELASKINVDWTHYTISAANQEDIRSDWLDLTQHAPFDDETWFSVVRLLNRSWFSRLWIWQEVFLAHKGATMICGHSTISWEQFRKAILSLYRRRKPDRVPDLHRTVTRAWQICNLNDQPSLRTILRRTKDAKCSDQRDRIYGVLNLVQENQRLGIQPDYTKTTLEVFRDMMVNSIFEYGDLTLLTCCELHDERGDIPSWVPNWSVSRKCKEIWGARACWNSLPQAKYKDGDAHLNVIGRRMGTILRAQQILTDDSSSLASVGKVPQLRETYAALKSLTSWLRDQLEILDFDEQLESIYRTICGNEFSHRYEPVNENHMDFRESLAQFRVLADPKTNPTNDFLKSCAMLLDAFYTHALARSFIVTADSHVGLAPKTARQGDIVAVLLGCQSPIILRPSEDDDEEEYLVIGEAYVHGLMTGEAFLGPLSSNWQRVARYDESTGISWDAFIDRGRSVWQVADPRLGPLPEGWAEEKHPMQHIFARYRNLVEGFASIYDPRMMLFALRARNVELYDFKLI
ncbi:MAG: hypothetical protein LQ341_005222, partial [Variospora aurantia]